MPRKIPPQRFFTQTRYEFDRQLQTRSHSELLALAIPLSGWLDLLELDYLDAKANYLEAQYRWAAINRRLDAGRRPPGRVGLPGLRTGTDG
ncbi:MAG: hypothetical protein ACTHJX_07035 [Terriglobales bacterium]